MASAPGLRVPDLSGSVHFEPGLGSMAGYTLASLGDSDATLAGRTRFVLSVLRKRAAGSSATNLPSLFLVARPVNEASALPPP